MQYKFTPSGVCSMQITFDMENDIVTNVKFLGGCAGNTQGVARLCEVEMPMSLLRFWKEYVVATKEHLVRISWLRQLKLH